jgi:hypothetical protein
MSGIIEGFKQRRVRSDGIGIDTLVGAADRRCSFSMAGRKTRMCWAAWRRN